MDERDWLAERFEEHRSHVRAVAYRMLGSVSEADDAERGGRFVEAGSLPASTSFVFAIALSIKTHSLD